MLIPLVVGIGLYEWGRGISVWAGGVAISLCLVATAVAGLAYRRTAHFQYRWMFGVSVFWAFVGLGETLAWQHDRQVNVGWPESRMCYRACLLEMPEAKENSVLCKVHVVAAFDSVHTYPIKRDILLYLSKDAENTALHLDDELVFYTKVKSPSNRGNPYEFDYARYLSHQGISGVAYADSACWRVVEGNIQMGLKQWALCCREKVLQRYRDLHFEGDVFAVLSALTVGYKEELSEDVRKAYSQAGVSHVLALSGLHIGILYGLLLGLFRLVMPFRRFAVMKGVILCLVLWAFAFISGLSASVVRSVLMFSLLIVARVLQRQRTGLNAICIAAFFMLLWNPFYLFDVSFQLSFSAVTGIVVGVPWLMSKMPVRNRYLSRFLELTWVSVAAQVATLPLILYYFSGFPLYAILLNIPVLFLTTLILWFALFLLLAGLFPPLQMWLAPALAWFVTLQNQLAAAVQWLPSPVIDFLSFQPVDVLLAYSFLVLLLFWGMGWIRMRWVILELFCALGIIYHVTYYQSSKVRQPQVVFYNTPQPLIHYVDTDGMSYLQGDSLALTNFTQGVVNNYRQARCLEEPRWISVVAGSSLLWTAEEVTCFHGYKVCVVKDGRWRHCIAPAPYPVDCLYLTRGFRGTLNELTALFTPGKVILHPSLGHYRVDRLWHECLEQGVECVLLGKDGALSVNI